MITDRHVALILVSLLIFFVVTMTALLTSKGEENKKEYEPSSWHCEEVRLPKFKDGQMFRSGECILWRRIIDEEDYEKE